MHCNLKRLLALAVIAAAHVTINATAQGGPTPQALLEQLRATSTVIQTGMQPLLLQATIQMFDGAGAVRSTSVVDEQVMSAQLWRRTVTSGDRKSTLYFADGKQLREGSVDPDVSDVLSFLLDPLGWTAGNGSPARVQVTNSASRELECYSVTPKGGIARDICLSAKSKLLRVVNGAPGFRVNRNRILKLGDTYVAGDLEIVRLGKLSATVHVDRLAAAPDLHEADFVPPANARAVPAPGAVVPPRRISGDDPPYPPSAKARGMDGVVMLRIEILKDGSVGKVEMVSSPDKAFEGAAIDAVRRWRFSPATLNGVPTEFTTTVVVSFRR